MVQREQRDTKDTSVSRHMKIKPSIIVLLAQSENGESWTRRNRRCETAASRGEQFFPNKVLHFQINLHLALVSAVRRRVFAFYFFFLFCFFSFDLCQLITRRSRFMDFYLRSATDPRQRSFSALIALS